MAIQLPTYSIARPSKIYPRWNFWFENMPSGNPETGGGERTEIQLVNGRVAKWYISKPKPLFRYIL
jgi:hypothetical protein